MSRKHTRLDRAETDQVPAPSLKQTPVAPAQGDAATHEDSDATASGQSSGVRTPANRSFPRNRVSHAAESAQVGKLTAGDGVDSREPAPPQELPHQTERQVHQHLTGQVDLSFSSLVVRRMDNGLCLQGVVEFRDNAPDFEELVREVATVDHVISQLVLRPRPR